MSRRLLGLCLLAYPRAQRRADGDFLRDVAIELAERRGSFRQAWSLVTGGVRERIYARRRSVGSWSPRRRWAMAAVGVATVAALGLGLAAFGSTDTDVEVRSCVESTAATGASGCADLGLLAAARERQGWDCSTRHQVVDSGRRTDLVCRRVA